MGIDIIDRGDEADDIDKIDIIDIKDGTDGMGGILPCGVRAGLMPARTPHGGFGIAKKSRTFSAGSRKGIEEMG